MSSRAIVAVGMQFGDEGKGATVDMLCRKHPVDWVIRYCGGSQAAHNVVLPDGTHHTFAQWGSGTLASHARTYLGRHVIINPPAMLNEARHLVDMGIVDPFALLHVDADCLVSTPDHQVLNQCRELDRGANRHGSCGHGIGETRHYWLRHGGDALVASDLTDSHRLRAKLELIRRRVLAEVGPLMDRLDGDGRAATAELLGTSVADIASNLRGIGRRLRVIASPPEFSLAVFEGAQGVLLDERHGFHPHTTWSTVTTEHALEMTGACDSVYVLGICRAFTVRHGAGPHPTFNPSLNDRLCDALNPWNAWQGDLRHGYLDLPLLKYAADVIRLHGPLDGIALNHLDLAGDTQLIGSYDWLRLDASRLPSLNRQGRLGKQLGEVVPRLRVVNRETLIAAVDEIAPVVIQGFGPTHEDRIGDKGEDS